MRNCQTPLASNTLFYSNLDVLPLRPSLKSTLFNRPEDPSSCLDFRQKRWESRDRWRAVIEGHKSSTSSNNNGQTNVNQGVLQATASDHHREAIETGSNKLQSVRGNGGQRYLHRNLEARSGYDKRPHQMTHGEEMLCDLVLETMRER